MCSQIDVETAELTDGVLSVRATAPTFFPCPDVLYVQSTTTGDLRAVPVLGRDDT